MLHEANIYVILQIKALLNDVQKHRSDVCVIAWQLSPCMQSQSVGTRLTSACISCLEYKNNANFGLLHCVKKCRKEINRQSTANSKKVCPSIPKA